MDGKYTRCLSFILLPNPPHLEIKPLTRSFSPVCSYGSWMFRTPDLSNQRTLETPLVLIIANPQYWQCNTFLVGTAPHDFGHPASVTPPELMTFPSFITYTPRTNYRDGSPMILDHIRWVQRQRWTGQTDTTSSTDRAH